MKKLIVILLFITNFSFSFTQSSIIETEKSIITKLNNYRTYNKLMPLTYCRYMQEAATIQCKYLSNEILTITHKNEYPGLETPLKRFLSTNPDYVPMFNSECISMFFNLDATEILNQFKNSIIHNQLLLSDKYIGVVGIKILQVKNNKTTIPYYIAVLVLG